MTDIDEKELDEAFKLVAGMKSAGIYTILSPYWGSHTEIEKNWRVPDPKNGKLSALVFWVPEVQEAYKGYLRALYTRPNPYTGIALKDEPAVAIIQLQNEDSMLFWTMQSVGGEPHLLLRRLYADWLKKKYGSLEAARAAWKNYPYTLAQSPDNWDEGLPGLFIVWEFCTNAWKEKQAQPGFRERRADQLQFFGETMYAFNREIGRYLREDLGCRQLVNAGNWKTVDPVLVDPVERYTYTANEVIGKNHYFGALHTGRTRGWQILPDHIFTDLSATRDPLQIPTNAEQVRGHTFIIPESLWVPPNRYESEGPLIIASQQCLNGVDAFFWFANGVPEWNEALRGSSLPKWCYATPMQLGQFPAAALMFRKAYLREGQPVIVERRSLAHVWQGVEPVISESGSYDPNRDKGNYAPEVKLDSVIDPLAFLVGPVQVEFDADPAQTQMADCAPFIDRKQGTVRANTGEIQIDYARGLYKVTAPAVQAAAGFLRDCGVVDLGDVRLECRNDHASLVVIALDGKPLKLASRVLVQAGTFQRPTGWRTEEIELDVKGQPQIAYRIVDTGRNPWQIRKLEATLSIDNATLTKATLLDANGMAVRAVAVQRDGARLSLTLPPETLYLILE